MRFGPLRASGGSYGRLKVMAYTGMTLSIVALVVVGALSVELGLGINQRRSSSSTTLAPLSLNGMLITPPLSLMDAPPILADQPFGQRLTNINVPLNSTQLSVINGEPESYYETAAQMWLNGSLSSLVGQRLSYSPLITVNGKPTVFYLGAISCVYCAENRWAMALALSRFGAFQNLFFGYSALGDQDVPTIYWAPAHYNASSAVEFGNFFNGMYVNFLSVEYSSPITARFQMQTLSYFQQQANSTGNEVYTKAMDLVVNLNNFAGTPYTIWGNYVVPGADATNFGDVTSTSSTSASTSVTSSSSAAMLPITSMTHDQILQAFAHPATPFAWTEYAAADYYVALICASVGAVASSSSMSPPICASPSISAMSTAVRAGVFTPSG